MNEENSQFKEDDLKSGHHFKMHLDAVEPATHHSVEHTPHHIEKDDDSDLGKRDLKTVLKDAGRQLFASLVILVLGFLILNWSAYYQLAQGQWNNWFGSKEASPLTQLVEGKPVVYNTDNFQASSNPSIQKRQIPPLSMEIAPSDDRIIIPRINQNIPIVKISSDSLIKRDWDTLENEMQKALQDGVVHYPGTSLPGQTGNVVVTGHSSYFPWDPGRFKDVFALLHDVEKGDRIVIYYNQDKYLYEVNDKKVVMPDNIEVLKQTPDDRITLITCTPVGTNLKRLIVTAKLIGKNDKPL
jgi:sortase A